MQTAALTVKPQLRRTVYTARNAHAALSIACIMVNNLP